MFLSVIERLPALTFDFVNKKKEVSMATQFNTSLHSSNPTAQSQNNNRHSDVIIIDITGV